MTLTEFSNTAPSSQTVSFYYDNQGGVQLDIQAINVSFADCSNDDLFETLENLTHFGFSYANGQYMAVVSQSVQKSTYYHYTLESLTIPASGLTGLVGSCNDVTLLPGPDPIGFSTSDYNVQMTNALDNRRSNYIFEVDRNFNQTVPGNYDNIISESAVKAEVADSNFSSVGIVNSRYAGSVSSKADYGIEAVFGPKLIKSEIYTLDPNPLVDANQSNSTIVDICSKSEADREFVDILFAPSILDLSGSNQILASTPDVRFIDTAMAKVNTYPGWGTTDTTIKFHGYGPTQILTGSHPGFELDLEVGDLFTHRYGPYAEIMKVTSVDLEIGPSGGPLPNITGSYGVVRNYYGNRDQAALLVNATGVSGGGLVSIRKLVGDTILRADTTKAEKLTDKKLYIQDSNNILYVNDEGMVIFNIHTCTK